jgi:dynein light intermediate chain 1, cytosolic
MEDGAGLGSSVGPDGARKAGGARVAPPPTRGGSSGTLGGAAMMARPGTPNSPPAGQSQNEVLHNFFQSLLTPRDRAGTAGARVAAAAAAGKKTNGAPTEPEEGS